MTRLETRTESSSTPNELILSLVACLLLTTGSGIEKVEENTLDVIVAEPRDLLVARGSPSMEHLMIVLSEMIIGKGAIEESVILIETGTGLQLQQRISSLAEKPAVETLVEIENIGIERVVAVMDGREMLFGTLMKLDGLVNVVESEVSVAQREEVEAEM